VKWGVAVLAPRLARARARGQVTRRCCPAHPLPPFFLSPAHALISSCTSDECGGGGIYADFVMTTVVSEDTSRPPWPSCPANGWTSGVDALWGLPNGSPLGLQPRLAAASGGEEWQQLVLRGGCSAQAGAVGAPTAPPPPPATARCATLARCPPSASPPAASAAAAATSASRLLFCSSSFCSFLSLKASASVSV
jgi:hypothetical protein